MNSVILETLSNVELRDGAALKAALVDKTSAGQPWLDAA